MKAFALTSIWDAVHAGSSSPHKSGLSETIKKVSRDGYIAGWNMEDYAAFAGCEWDLARRLRDMALCYVIAAADWPQEMMFLAESFGFTDFRYIASDTPLN